MPRYFFNIREHGILDEDTVGAEMPSNDFAYDEAVKAARELISEKVLKGVPIDGQIFEITNDAGDVVHTVPFKSVLSYE